MQTNEVKYHSEKYCDGYPQTEMKEKKCGRVDSALQSLSLEFEEEKPSDLPSPYLLPRHAGLLTGHCTQVCKITLV